MRLTLIRGLPDHTSQGQGQGLPCPLQLVRLDWLETALIQQILRGGLGDVDLGEANTGYTKFLCLSPGCVPSCTHANWHTGLRRCLLNQLCQALAGIGMNPQLIAARTYSIHLKEHSRIERCY